MLTIRRDQLRALEHAVFEEWMVRHAEKHMPRHCAALGANGVRKAVRDAAAVGRSLGFSDADLAHFVDLTFIFGESFHTSARYPWAAHILHDNVTTNPRHRIDRLYTAAIDHLRSLTAQSPDSAYGR